MNNLEFPYIPLELLEHLEEAYDTKLPSEIVSHEEICRRIGRNDILMRLRVEYNRQNNIE